MQSAFETSHNFSSRFWGANQVPWGANYNGANSLRGETTGFPQVLFMNNNKSSFIHVTIPNSQKLSLNYSIVS